MRTEYIMYACSVLFAAAFIIAAAAIGTECYNAPGHENFKKEKMSNFNFNIVAMVFAILFVLSACYGMYVGVTSN